MREQNAETSETICGAEGPIEGDEHMYDQPLEEEHDDEHNELPKSQELSDEFGDDDFDADLVDALDVSPKKPEQPALSTSYVTIPTEPIHPPPQQQLPQAAAPRQAGSDDDEFGLDDEDDFAADMEHVASLYDTRAMESPTPNLAPVANTASAAAIGSGMPAAVISLIDDDDEDEFGGDIDADEFAAAEVAATQVPTNTVRRLRTYP
jgi:DNA replication ATP-dependent helicase Dna2